jgi:hypothetical protein
MLTATWTLAMGAAQAADCAMPLPAVIFESQLSDVEQALNAKNLAQMSQRLTELEKQVPCIAQPITAAQAGRYHLIHGINLWISKESTTAKLHFSAAKAAAADIGIPTTVFPSAHQIHETFATAPLIDDAETFNGTGQTFFDGAESDQRPLYRPTIFQAGLDGKIAVTQIVLPGEPLPGYALPEPKPAETKQAATTPSPAQDAAGRGLAIEAAKTPSPIRVPLLGATAATAASTAGMFFLYWNSYTAHHELFTAVVGDGTNPGNGGTAADVAQADRLMAQNTVGLAGTALMGAATMGLGVTLAMNW